MRFRPAHRLRVEPLEGVDRSRVEAHLEDLLVDPDRRSRVAELLVVELRLLEEELLPLPVVLGHLGAALDHLEERRVVAGLFVERLERHEGAAVVGPEVERLLVVLLREAGLAERRARDLRDAERDLELQLAVADLLDRRPEELDELDVLARGGGEPLGALDPRRQLGIGHRLAEAAGRVRERANGVAERTLGHLRGARDCRELRGHGVGVLRLDLEDAEELLVLAVGLVQRVEDLRGLEARARVVEQGLERRTAALVRRLDRERLPVRLDGGSDVAELLLPHLAEAREDAQLVVRGLRQAEVGLERLRQVQPAVGELVQRRERGERRPVGAVVVDDGAVREDRGGDVGEALGERPRDAHEERAPAFAVVGLALAGPQDLHELRPALGALVQPVEGRERVRVARVVLEPRAPRLDGAARVVEHGLAQLAQAAEELAARLGAVLEADLDAEDLSELLAVAARVDALERPARGQRDRRVVRRELEHLPVHGLGARRVVEVVLAEAREVHQDVGARHGRGPGGGGGGEHARGALVRREAPGDLQGALAGARVVGVERQEPRERLERAGVVAQALVAQVGHAAEQIAPLVGAGRELEVDLEDAHELGHLVSGGVDGLEDDRRARAQRRHVEDLLDELPRLRRARPLLEHLLQVGEGARGVAELHEEQRAEALVRDRCGRRPRSLAACARGAARASPTAARRRRGRRASGPPARAPGRSRGCARSTRWPSAGRR